MGTQKVLLASFVETQDPSYVIYQLADLLMRIVKEKKSSSNSTITTRDVLLLTLHMYSLFGDSIVVEPQHEQYLQESFVNAMLAVFIY
jgi:hypothetical protein